MQFQCIRQSNIILFHSLGILELCSIILYATLIKLLFTDNPIISEINTVLIITLNVYYFTLLLNLILIIVLYFCGINAIAKLNLRSFTISIIAQVISIIAIGLNAYFNYDWTTSNDNTDQHYHSYAYLLWEMITNWVMLFKGAVYLCNAIISVIAWKGISNEKVQRQQGGFDDKYKGIDGGNGNEFQGYEDNNSDDNYNNNESQRMNQTGVTIAFTKINELQSNKNSIPNNNIKESWVNYDESIELPASRHNEENCSIDSKDS